MFNYVNVMFIYKYKRFLNNVWSDEHKTMCIFFAIQLHLLMNTQMKYGHKDVG